MKCFAVIVFCLTLIALAGSATIESESGSNVAVNEKRQGDYVESDEEIDDEADVMYDERQMDGDTNIRLHIKNLQIQVPESSFDTFQNADMATVIRNSILKLLGIPYEESDDSDPDQQEVTAQEQQQHIQSDSMLQVNGNNLPAKFFLEISDFLMRNQDNDAVDDKRVESNHRNNVETYATEEIKIERLENVNNVKNETITISKKRYHNGGQHVGTPNQTLLETNSTENKFSNNVTHNHTETEDRFQQIRPIRLDTVVMQVDTDSGGKPKTLREKVIWRMDSN